MRACVLLAVVTLLSLWTSAPRGAIAGPKGVSSKGIKYMVELPGSGGGAPMHLCIEPGRDAWLFATWGVARKSNIRSGRGLRWANVRDTRRGEIHSSLLLEVEPLGSHSFDHAVAAYRTRLASYWTRSYVQLKRVVGERPARTVKIDGQTVKGLRLDQELIDQESGDRMAGCTVFLPLHGHLVVLTGFGVEDVVTPALRGLGAAPKRWAEKEHTYHCVDFWGNPTALTYLVLPLPAGFEVVPGTPEEGEPDLVNRWRHTQDGGAEETVSFVRLGRSETFTPANVLRSWAHPRRSQGIEPDDPRPFKLRGTQAATMSYVVRDDRGHGTLLAWKSNSTIYGLHWNTTETDGEEVGSRRAALMACLRRLRTWYAVYAR